MKKVMLAVIAMLGFAISGFAQEGAKKPAKKSDDELLGCFAF